MLRRQILVKRRHSVGRRNDGLGGQSQEASYDSESDDSKDVNSKLSPLVSKRVAAQYFGPRPPIRTQSMGTASL